MMKLRRREVMRGRKSCDTRTQKVWRASFLKVMDRNAMPRLIIKCYPVNKLGIEGKRYNKRINT